jgi:gas vesicle protein
MDKFGKFLAGVFIGGMIGGVLGLLLAPAPGRQTTENVVQKFNYVKDEVQKAAAQRSEELRQELAVLQKKV